MKLITSNKKKKLLIAILVALISVWHYSTDVHHPVLHILHRELYIIPIVFAAYWFGKKGGLTASVVASLLFLPWIFMNHEVTFTNQLNNTSVPTFDYV
jgi:riboflavin transporter FmnP